MAQLVRASPCHGEGRRFEVRSGSLKDFNPCGVLAQLGEHLPYKQRVIGSSPIGPISIENGFKCYANVTDYGKIEGKKETKKGKVY